MYHFLARMADVSRLSLPQEGPVGFRLSAAVIKSAIEKSLFVYRIMRSKARGNA